MPGVTHFGLHSDLDWDAFRQMLDTNVTSVVRMTNGLLPLLEQTSGGLLLVSSMAGIFPVPFQTAYSATKAFLVHFGCGLCHEYQGRSVSITTYTPGGVVSEMTAGESFTPLRRWLMPTQLCGTRRHRRAPSAKVSVRSGRGESPDQHAHTHASPTIHRRHRR